MPDCKYCHTQLAFWEYGAICPDCQRMYTVNQVAQLPDYDRVAVREAAELYKLLSGAGMLKQGVNRLTYGDGDLKIEHEQGDW